MRRYLFFLLAMVGLFLLVPAALWPSSARRAGAAGCDDPAGDAANLFTVVSPPVQNYQASGVVPLAVTVQVAGGVVVFPSNFLSARFDWGDGSGGQAVGATPCGDGETAYWPQQTYSHSYTTPGNYTVSVILVLQGQSYPLPIVFLTATTAAATPTPAPSPTTAPPTAAPTEPPTTQATPQLAVLTAAPTEAPTPTVAATLTPGTTSATPTATPTPTQVPPTAAAATPVVPVAAAPASTPPASPPLAPTTETRPEIVESVRDIGEISTDPEVVGTNAVLAGATVWVLFSSVFLNQVMQDNRPEIERRTRLLRAPLHRLRRRVRHGPRTGGGQNELLRRTGATAAVLVVTGLIYSALDPGFGLNKSTYVLFASAAIGVGLVTYLYSGLEAMMVSRTIGAPAAVRAYPACIAIAVVSVVISRSLDLQPGVMYGFVASCVVLTPTVASERDKGRIALVPVTAALVVAVSAWLLLSPIRSMEHGGGNWMTSLLEAVAIIVFAGGIESLVVSLIPVAATDGGKIYRWKRPLWVLLAMLSSFLAWHVLFGRDRAFFSGLRQTSSVAIVTLFIVYTALSIGLWGYFRFRGGKEARPAPHTGDVPA